MNFKLFFWLIITLSVFSTADGQPRYKVTSYSTNNGLAQTTATCFLQSKNGILWLSTWNGINKFDGYDFTTYKTSPQRNTALSNNRITHIAEDKYGCIWACGYDGKLNRFNPTFETFENISLPHHFAAAKTHIFRNGHIWIQSKLNEVVRLCFDKEKQKWHSDINLKQKKEASNIILHEDSCGNEWIGGESCGIYLINPNSKKLISICTSGVYCVLETPQAVLWGSDKGKVFAWNKKNMKKEELQYPINSKIKALILHNDQLVIISEKDGIFVNGQLFKPTKEKMISAVRDKQERIWIKTENAHLVQFNLSNYQSKDITLLQPNKRTNFKQESIQIKEDSKGNIWIYPYHGQIALYQNDQIYPITQINEKITWEGLNRHYVFFIDKQDNLWLSTSRWLGKISLYEPFFKKTVLYQPEETFPEESNIIRSVMQAKDNTLWIGNRFGEILLYSDNMEFIGKLTKQGSISSNRNKMQFIGKSYYLMQDSKERIWIGTKGEGLWLATPTKNKNKPYNLIQFKHNAADKYSLNNDLIYWLQEDGNGRIWIATYGGGICYLEENDHHFHFFHSGNRLTGYPLNSFDKIRCLCRDSNGNIWVGSTNGILTFNEDFNKPENIKFHPYQHQIGNAKSLSNNNVQNILQTTKKKIYIATFGGGLCEAIAQKNNSYTFYTHTPQKGIPSDILYSLAEDQQGNIWMAEENGLSRFNTKQNTFDYFNDLQIGFSPMFNEGKSLCLKDETMMFTTLDGLLRFCPKEIKKSLDKPNLVFTQLLLGGDEVIETGNPILPQSIDATKQIVLPHDQNLFTLHFATTELTNPDNVSYAYQLKGFDKQWNKLGKQRSASYTNLPTGSYLFKVCSTNGDGVWVNNTRTLRIIVQPSFWETPVAWFLYFLLALFIFGLVFYFHRLRNRLYIEHETNQYKLQFFTDISHELRTPLTLITAPIENLINHKELPVFVNEQLSLIQRNARQMQHLINQILEFRKLQNGQIQIQWETIETVSFIKRIADNFSTLALERNFSFYLTSNTQHCIMKTDAEKFESIINNLISNAFKYTPNGKDIEIIIHAETTKVSISIKDKGIGIPPHLTEYIFTRFANLHTSTLSGSPTTGIGLALVKELTERLEGQISVISKEGEGSTFSVTFGCKCSDLLPEKETILLTKHFSESLSKNNLEQLPNPDIPSLLIVEDNGDMRQFLRNIFCDKYRILEAQQGKDGISLALQQQPDIVITDLMMPVMDGLQLVNAMKSNLETSHIPIILLTAKENIQSRLDAMKKGADDYITKPFSALYLQARVENLLIQRKKLQQLYRKKLLDDQPDSLKQTNEQDKQEEQDIAFLNSLKEIMNEQIDNEELTVDMLIKPFFMSRTAFFVKLKNLTGLSPNEFIQHTRIKKAAELIKQNNYNLNEIASMVGYKDSRYFSRLFKKIYGITPSEYKKGEHESLL